MGERVLDADAGDLASGQKREGHDGNLPELDLEQRSDIRRAVAAGADRAKADREAVEGALLDQRRHITGAPNLFDQAAADIEAELVLADLFPDADRFVREVLIEHAHALGRTLPQRTGERPGRDAVARPVGHVEERGIAFEL